MGNGCNCIDRDDDESRKHAEAWSTMVSGGELHKSRPSLVKSVSDPALRKHFLSRAYLNGVDLCLDQAAGSSYKLELLDRVSRVRGYRHEGTGIIIWNQALDVSNPEDEELELLFLYMRPAVFQDLTDAEQPVLSEYVWESLQDSLAPHGPGIYASGREPSALDKLPQCYSPRRGAVTLGYCVPILATKRDVYNIARRATPEMDDAAVAPGHRLDGRPMEGSDLWVLRKPHVAHALAAAASNVERRWRRILQFREESGHPGELEAAAILGAVLSHRGKCIEAEPLLQRAFDGCREKLGLVDASTLQLLERFVSALEQLSRPDDAVLRLNEASTALKKVNRLDDAEQLYRRALQIQENAKGVDHIETLRCVNSLALVLKTRGKLAEAEPLYSQVMMGREFQLGARHPDTLRSCNNLAVLLQARSKFDKAEPLFRSALQGSEAYLGANHAETVTCTTNLAGLLKKLNRYDEAESLYRRALEAREMESGAQSAEALTSVNNLAVLLQRKGALEEAEQLHRRALMGREQRFGAHHPETVTSAGNLAVLLHGQGRFEESLPLNRRVLDINLNRYGVDDTNTQDAARLLVASLQALGRQAEADAVRSRFCIASLTDDSSNVSCNNSMPQLHAGLDDPLLLVARSAGLTSSRSQLVGEVEPVAFPPSSQIRGGVPPTRSQRLQSSGSGVAVH